MPVISFWNGLPEGHLNFYELYLSTVHIISQELYIYIASNITIPFLGEVTVLEALPAPFISSPILCLVI